MRLLWKDEKGFALIVTVLIVSILVVLTLRFFTVVQGELHGASNVKDGVRLACMARSGFQCAMAILAADGKDNDTDTLLETWARLPELSGQSESLFEGGGFFLQVHDLSGRLPLRALVREDGSVDDVQRDLLIRLLSSEVFSLGHEEARDLADAIVDWMDPDDEVTGFGAESSYYRQQEPPYECRNGPFPCLTELLLVRGVTPELFYGTGERPGISRYLTVHGKGPININTAEPLVLAVLSDEMDMERALNMHAYRMEEGQDLGDPAWYRNVTGMGDVVFPAGLAGTRSQVFDILSTGVDQTMSRTVQGVVERESGGRLRIVSWQAE